MVQQAQESTKTPSSFELSHHNLSTLIYSELKKLQEGGSGPYPTDINLIVDEFNVTPSGNLLVLVPAIDRPVLITSMIVSIPSGTSGVLAIGAPSTSGQNYSADARLIGLTPQTPPFNGIGLVIYQNDVFTITTTGAAGLIFLEIMGLGLRGTAWRRI